MVSDPIGDFLIRIKNGYLARKKKVTAPFSKIKEKLAKILVDSGYLAELKRDKNKLIVRLRYPEGKPALEEVRRISKPGCRIYKKRKEIKPVRSGFGMAIISTPKGLMTDKEARKKNLGGEVICEIW